MMIDASAPETGQWTRTRPTAEQLTRARLTLPRQVRLQAALPRVNHTWAGVGVTDYLAGHLPRVVADLRQVSQP